MKHQYRFLKKTAESIGVSLLCVFCIIVIEALRAGTMDKAGVLALAESKIQMFLLVAAGYVCCVEIVNSYWGKASLHISFGYTRKRLFWEVQGMKCLTMLGAAVLSVLLSGAVKGIFEAFSAFYIRYQRLVFVPVMLISGACGFGAAYLAAGFAKNGIMELHVNVQQFEQQPVLWGLMFLAGIVLLGVCSWKLLQKAEIHI